MSGVFGVVVKTAPGETAPNPRNCAELRGLSLQKPRRFTRSPATTNPPAGASYLLILRAMLRVRPSTTLRAVIR